MIRRRNCWLCVLSALALLAMVGQLLLSYLSEGPGFMWRALSILAVLLPIWTAIEWWHRRSGL